MAKAKQKSESDDLLAALDFVSAGFSNLQDFSQYVKLENKQAVVFNGQISAGYPIAEELTLCPQLERFKAALNKCGDSVAITETETGQLSVKGAKLRAIVPCHKEALPPAWPDEPAFEGDFDVIKEAFKVCGTLASEAGERVHLASLLLENGSCTSTNGAAILQFWHGLPLPPYSVIPKIFAASVAKQKMKITAIGAKFNVEQNRSESLTFWFENGAWLKCQCYFDKWPNVSPVLDVATNPVPIGFDLQEAISSILDFTEEKKGMIHFANGFVQSHETDNIGAQYKADGLTGGKAFDGKLLKQITGHATSFDLTTYQDKMMFFGGKPENPIRGAVMGVVRRGTVGTN